MLVSCGDDKKDSAVTSMTTVSSSIVDSTTGPAESELDDFVMTEAPPGYEPLPIGLATGPFDLGRFLTAYSTAEDEDRRLLTACGFKRGLHRGWLNQAELRGFAVFVFECDSNRAAAELGDGFAAEDERLNDASESLVPEIPEARGRSYLQGKDQIDIVAFVRGERLYLVQLQSVSNASQLSTAVDLAKLQARIAQ